MSWTERLQELRNEQNGPSCSLPKLTKDPFVSNVSEQNRHSREIRAPKRMPSRGQLEAICRRAVADYPAIPAERLRRLLEVAEDPEWCSERVARHIARRMAEGLIVWEPGR